MIWILVVGGLALASWFVLRDDDLSSKVVDQVTPAVRALGGDAVTTSPTTDDEYARLATSMILQEIEERDPHAEAKGSGEHEVHRKDEGVMVYTRVDLLNKFGRRERRRFEVMFGAGKSYAVLRMNESEFIRMHYREGAAPADEAQPPARDWSDPLSWMKSPLEMDPLPQDDPAALLLAKWQGAYQKTLIAKSQYDASVEMSGHSEHARIALEENVAARLLDYQAAARNAEARRERYERYVETGD